MCEGAVCACRTGELAAQDCLLVARPPTPVARALPLPPPPPLQA